MKVGKALSGDNLSIYAGDKENSNSINASEKNVRKDKNEKNQKKTNVIYAGDINLSGQDSTTFKKLRAQKQAMKTMLDQFKKDQKIDNNIVERKQHIEDLNKEALDDQKQIDNVTNMKKQLKDAYQVTDDSKEQKDLDLLEKSMDPTKDLTDDEMKQLREIGPLTDYQKSALEYDTMQKIWKNRLDNANAIKSGEGKTIDAINLERLKSHEMVDCQKEAAEIIEKVMKELLGSYMEEAKDNIDEKLENQVDNKDNKEKANNSSNQTDAASRKDGNKVQNTSNNESTADQANLLTDADLNLKKIQTEVKYKVKNNILLEEDIKGISVDEQL